MGQNNQQGGQRGSLDQQQRNSVSDSDRSSQSSDMRRDKLQDSQQSGNLQSGTQQGNRQRNQQSDELLDDGSVGSSQNIRSGSSQQQDSARSQDIKKDQR